MQVYSPRLKSKGREPHAISNGMLDRCIHLCIITLIMAIHILYVTSLGYYWICVTSITVSDSSMYNSSQWLSKLFYQIELIEPAIHGICLDYHVQNSQQLPSGYVKIATENDNLQ